MCVKPTPILDDLGINILDTVAELRPEYFCRDRAKRSFVVAVRSLLRYKCKDGSRRCSKHRRFPNQSTTLGGAMAVLDVTQKAGIYETLSSLNTAFAGIVQHLNALQKTGLFKSKTAKLFPDFTQELQSEINQELLEEVHQFELDDWGRYGKAREKWEKHLRDPDDVFIHAEERRKQLAKQKRKKH